MIESLLLFYLSKFLCLEMLKGWKWTFYPNWLALKPVYDFQWNTKGAIRQPSQHSLFLYGKKMQWQSQKQSNTGLEQDESE